DPAFEFLRISYFDGTADPRRHERPARMESATDYRGDPCHHAGPCHAGGSPQQTARGTLSDRGREELARRTPGTRTPGGFGGPFRTRLHLVPSDRQGGGACV